MDLQKSYSKVRNNYFTRTLVPFSKKTQGFINLGASYRVSLFLLTDLFIYKTKIFVSLFLPWYWMYLNYNGGRRQVSLLTQFLEILLFGSHLEFNHDDWCYY